MQISQAEIERVKLINPIRETAEGYGLKINREGFCSCPFHLGDNTASLKLYGNGTFHCFGCGANGDVIKFIQMMNNCNFYSALKLLGAEVDKQLSWTESRQLKRKQTERKNLQHKIDYVKNRIALIDNQISTQDRQIRACTMSEEEFTDEVETEAVQAENERMRLLAKRSNAETILKQYEAEYEQRYRHT